MSMPLVLAAIAATAIIMVPGASALGVKHLLRKGGHAHAAHARLLQAATSAQARRQAIEKLLRDEATAVEDAYKALVHQGETVDDMCYVRSVCAPRDEFELSFVDMYQPKKCKGPGGDVAAWADLNQNACPVNSAITRAMYEVDVASPSAIYPKKQGVKDDVHWRDTALQTPPNEDRVKKVMCATHALDKYWKDQYEDVPNTFWQYYGDQSTGIWKFFPGGGDTCSEYDPRMRPWYSSAATGPKDVVIVIDTSGSMRSQGRLGKASAAAVAVIDTLNAADYATVINFSGGSTSFSDNKNGVLVRADEPTRAAMKEWVNGLVATGSTNYEAAFKAAFDIVGKSRRQRAATGCHMNTILFLTDGEVTTGKQGADFLAYARQLNTDAESDTRVFTYAFGDAVVGNAEAAQLLQSLADQNKGVAFQIGDAGDGSDLKTTMAQYYVYWAAGIASTQPRWSEIYTDFGTGLDCLTGALPVYDRTKDPPELFGVVGIDVAPNDDGFADYADYDATIATMQEETRRCAEVHFTDQQIDALRGTLSPAVYAPAGAALDAPSMLDPDGDKYVCSTDKTKTSQKACEASGGKWEKEGGMSVPAIVGIVAALGLVGLVGVFACRKYNEANDAANVEAAARPPPVADGMAYPHQEDSIERIRPDAVGHGNVYYPTALPAGAAGANSRRGRRAPTAVPVSPPSAPPAQVPRGTGRGPSGGRQVAYL